MFVFLLFQMVRIGRNAQMGGQYTNKDRILGLDYKLRSGIMKQKMLMIEGWSSRFITGTVKDGKQFRGFTVSDISNV